MHFLHNYDFQASGFLFAGVWPCGFGSILTWYTQGYKKHHNKHQSANSTGYDGIMYLTTVLDLLPKSHFFPN